MIASAPQRVGECKRPLLLAVLIVALSAAVVFWVTRQSDAPRIDIAMSAGFAVAFFAARLLTIRLPQGDEVCVTLMVGLVGLAFVDVRMLIAASLVAGWAEAVARFAQARGSQFRSRLRDTIRNAAILGLLSPWQLVLHPLVRTQGDAIVIWALVAGACYTLLDVLTAATEHSLHGGLSVFAGMAALGRSLSTVYVVHISMAAVVLRLQGTVGVWPLPVAILLTLILQNSFNLYIRIRRAYAETIGALAHAAELDRPHDSGHARRVADLSVTVGRRLGLSSQELERVGYAALLHDIGRMGAVGEDSSGAHLRRGADIAASIPFLADVAPIILWTDCEGDTSPPVGWSVVRTCSRYDRLRSEVGAHAALEIMSGEQTSSDQLVIETLEAIVQSKQHSSQAASL